ncbi:hypothetical protein Cantr_07199 [Candida viswanathii]|uniref:Methyltransferase n=1 Tax=Candida viswanathii TaxID=5486 RepID=A0A367Y145_9ASCO|nr:hypothetical protein Cantr_07199 [Candida viswanathii]
MKRKAEEETSISICIPSSVISSKNAYNLEQATNIIYQIAKAATIYKVSEIIVFKSSQAPTKEEPEDKGTKKIVFNEEEEPNRSATSTDDPSSNDALLAASLLQFFITPPYLIKSMFSPHLNKKFTNIMPKFKHAFKLPRITTLDLSKDFKEGMIIPRETPLVRKKSSLKKVKADHKVTVSKYVNIGEPQAMKLDIKREIPIYSRVTVDLRTKTLVSAAKAYGNAGHRGAFGYLVRMVEDGDFSKVFTQSAVPEGYSSTVYVNCNDYFGHNKVELPDTESVAGGNILVVFGNLKDYKQDVQLLFDTKLSIPLGCKVEDAVLIALTKLT